MDKILILDFGSQYTQLIARRVREIGVYSEVQPFNYSLESIKEGHYKGIILSGGPNSIYAEGSPFCDEEILNLNIPIFGICYGMQLICHVLGGEVVGSDNREYGKTELTFLEPKGIFSDLRSGNIVWMSHGDKISQIPAGFEVLGSTANTPFTAIGNFERNIFAVQFHPEVVHTEGGTAVISQFVLGICGAQPDWNMKNFITDKIANIKETVGDAQVICAISGGVDSSVIATLINQAIGAQLHCIFVNNGLLRKNETEGVLNLLRNDLGLNIHYVDAEDQFLGALAGVSDPEQKRKIIGREFIRVFEKEALRIPDAKFLAQGTLYPDIIESMSVKGPSATIKSHHNVGGLPKDMKFELLEPARELFKDEVRALGTELGLSDHVINRHPFPGPGLAVRILGEVTKEKVAVLQKADDILIEELRSADLYKEIWQAFVVLLPVKTVGVMGDERTYDNVCAIRLVESIDGMTANPYEVSLDKIMAIANRITNEVKGISRVVYDLSSKPPATIEWE